MLVTAFAGGAAAAPAAKKGLVASYGFNEGASKGLRFGDYSGKGNGARGNRVRRVKGKFGKGLAFNGRDSFLSVRNRPSLDLSRGMTLQAWVKPQAKSGKRTILAKLGKGTSAYALNAATHTGGAQGEADLGRRAVAGTPEDLPLGVWSHVTLTYDGSTLRFYRDGQEVNATDVRGAMMATPGPLRIGGKVLGGGWFKGVIDDVRIYGRALSARAIQRDMRRPAGKPPPQPKKKPGAAPGAAPTPAKPGPFAFGVVSTRGLSHVDDVKVAGASLTRIEFAIGTPVADMRQFVGRAAGQGIEVILLAGFPSGIPSADQARSLDAWASEFGPGGAFWQGRPDGAYAVRRIEFGNESSYPYKGTQEQGGEYALRARDAAQSIAAANPGVGLLIQADDAGQGTQNPWINDMFDAVPDLGGYAAGWTIHPYGPRSSWESRIQYLIGTTAARGAPATIPIFMTEWGLATDDGNDLSDNYHWPTNMTYAQAGDAFTETIDGMVARFPGRLAALLYYFARDHAAPGASSDREDYFGVFKSDRSDKGALTAAIRSAAARYPAH